MSKQRDFIRNFMAFLDTTELSGVNALNEAVKICTKSKFTTLQALVDQMVADCRQTNDAEKFLQDYCGIDLTNEDTGAITGADAGGSIVKTAESVIPEVGSLQIYTKDSFTTRGGTFKLDKSYSSLTESEKFIWHALYTWWIPNALDLIAESYGKNYNLKDNTMTIHFKNLGYGTLASANNSILNINTEYYGNIDTSNVNGSANTSYLDRVISHELTHSVMFKNSSWSFPQFIMEGMAELTHGIDDERKYSILNIAGNADSLKSALNVDDYSTLWEPAYAGGYMFLRYFAEQFSDLSLEFTRGNDFYANYDSKKTLNALGGNDNVNNFSSDKVKIYGADGNDKIYSSDSNGVTIDGGKGNDSIFSSKNKKSKIYGGAGKDTIENTGNYVTLSGGSGNDSISNEGNKVTITGGAGNDSISNSGSNVTISGGTGNDSISSYGSNVKIYGGNGNDSIDNDGGSNVKISGGNGNDSIDNDGGSNVKISGGAGNDSISSYGSNVTITGGASKDYISLSSYDSENNVIQYAEGDGNDTIFGFNSDDTFHITKGSYSVKSNDSDVILNIGKDSVRFVNALYTPIKVKLSNGKTKTISLSIDNTKNNTVVSGTSANETISNSGSNVKIYGGMGNDTIYSNSSNVTISGGKGNDSISNDGSKTKIFGDSGNDTIYSNSSNVTISGGTGNDVINNDYYGSDVTISGDAGNDKIYSDGSNVTITGGAGNDSISNEGNKVTITGGTGNDSISSYGSKVTISGGAGNDTIENYDSEVTISGDSGNDSIYSGDAKNVKIYAGTGNDTIENYYGSKVTISGGAGNDSISNSGSEVTISGGTGNDSIFSSEAKYVTITGGAGKDYISLSSYGFGSEDIVIQYAEGDGNDTIYGFDFYDTFHITKGSYSAKADGNDVILTVGKSSVRFIGAIDTPIKVKTAKGKIETVTLDGDTDTQSGGGTDTQTGGGGGIDIHNYYNNTVVSGTNNNDTIYNGDLYYTSGNYMTIFGNGGNDYIQSTGSYVTISGDAGNDTIDNSRGRTVSILGGNGNDSISNISYNVTISGDNGNDFISNSGSEVMISGGNGNDSIGNDAISNSGSEVTISGGAGDDAISIDTYANTVLEYASGDGNDTIGGFNSDDTLNITSGTYTTQVIDYRVVVTVGEGKIILPNVGKQKINIVDSKGKLSELWVAEENNFISSDNLSSITENNLTQTSLEKIETNNLENLTRENNLITYSNK